MRKHKTETGIKQTNNYAHSAAAASSRPQRRGDEDHAIPAHKQERDRPLLGLCFGLGVRGGGGGSRWVGGSLGAPGTAAAGMLLLACCCWHAAAGMLLLACCCWHAALACCCWHAAAGMLLLVVAKLPPPLPAAAAAAAAAARRRQTNPHPLTGPNPRATLSNRRRAQPTLTISSYVSSSISTVVMVSSTSPRIMFKCWS